MSPAYPAFPAANCAPGGGGRASIHSINRTTTLEAPGAAPLLRNADPGALSGPLSRYAGTMTGTDTFRRTPARCVRIAAALALAGAALAGCSSEGKSAPAWTAGGAPGGPGVARTTLRRSGPPRTTGNTAPGRER